jgi:uncharacterized membrane protein YbhN (UPF0104 family)
MRRSWLFFAKAAIAVGLLGYVLRHADLDRVVGLLTLSDKPLFLVACLLLAGAVAINALRWNYVMASLGFPLGIGNAMIGNFEAMFFNQILPTGVGGDALRALRAYDAGAMSGYAVVGVLIDRAFGLWFVALCIVLALLLCGSPIVPTAAFRLLAFAASAVCLGGTSAVIVGAIIKADRLPAVLMPLVTLMQCFSKVALSRACPGRIVANLILANIMTIACFVLCARALGVSVGLWDAIIVLQGMVLASILPVSIGGWGLREGAAVLLFAGIGVQATEATAVSILFGLALSVIGIAGAVVWLASGYRRFGRAEDRRQMKLDQVNTASSP